MALSPAYARSRHAAALFVAGVAFGLPSVAFAQAATWVSADGATMHFKGLDGRTASLSLPKSLPPVANGTGGVLLKATQNVAIGPASSTLNLSRLVTGANLAKLARGASVLGGFGTALMALGLVYEGVQLLNGEWVKPTGLGDPIEGRWWAAESGSPTCTTFAHKCSFAEAMSASLALFAAQYPTWTVNGPTGVVTWQNGSGSPSVPSSSPAYRANFTYTVSGTTYTDSRSIVGSPVDAAWTPPEVPTVPATDAEVEQAIADALAGDPPKAVDLATALSGYVPVEQWVKEPLQITGPATVDGGTVTQTEVTPTGTTTRQVATTYNVTYDGNTITINQGDTITTTHEDQSVTTTTISTTQATQPTAQTGEPPEDKECGLPGTPKCAIDETGTPDGQGTDQAGMDAINNGAGAIEDGITGIGDAPIADLGFDLDVDLPAGSCAPLMLSYKSWSHATNWCPVLGVARDIWGWFIGVMGALYVFRRATMPAEG